MKYIWPTAVAIDGEDVKLDGMLLPYEKAVYASQVGAQFTDIEEDGQPVFEVCSIVTRKEDGLLYFAYKCIDIFEDDGGNASGGKTEQESDYEYTECDELMNSSWAQWL